MLLGLLPILFPPFKLLSFQIRNELCPSESCRSVFNDRLFAISLEITPKLRLLDFIIALRAALHDGARRLLDGHND